MELNEFDKDLRDLAIRHAPQQQIANCGETVIVQIGGWKQPHKVKIINISVEVSDIGLSIGRREELGITGWLTVQHQYIGRRLKSNGELVGSCQYGFLLNEFTTLDGQKYERIPSRFNHAGLVFEIESLGDKYSPPPSEGENQISIS